MMKIIPALDLLDQQCVRLYQGQYSEKTVYETSAPDLIRSFEAQGAKHIHMVDLQGAKNSERRQWKLIKDLMTQTQATLQVGGGVRSASDAFSLYEAGVEQVIIGSMAVRNPKATQEVLDRYPQTIIGADLTFKDGQYFIATEAWATTSSIEVQSFLKSFKNLNSVLSTDISRDGTLTSPNFSLYKDLQSWFPDKQFIASGGVSSLEDLKTLKEMNLYGVVVGKALLDGRFSLTEAYQC